MPHAPSHALGVTILSLHTSPLAQPGSGDAGGMNVFVLQSALALARRGAHVNIFTRSRASWTRSPAPGVRVFGLPAGGDRHLSKEELRSITDEFAHRVASHPHFDPNAAVHSHYWLSGLSAMSLQESTGRDFAHTMHTTAAAKHRHAPGAHVDLERLDAEALIASAAGVLTANTHADRAELLADFDVSPERVRVVSPGIDTSVFTPDGPVAPWPLSTPGPRLLFAGRIQPYKGPQVAIGAVGRLAKRGISASLVLLGDRSGQGAQDPAALAASAGVASRVLSLPPVPQHELAAWFRAADAVLMPSKHETYGLVAAEALACGTPVLGHDVGGLSTLIRDGVDGRLLRELDPETWAQAVADWGQDGVPDTWSTAAAQAGRARGWETTAAALETAYARLLG